MNYSEFLNHVRTLEANPVILMIGKRNVPEKDQHQLTDFAAKLADDLPHCLFRSGNAGGADSFFTQGVQSVAPERMQVVLPYASHRRSERNESSSYYALEPTQLAEEDPVVYKTKELHPESKRMIPGYLAGQKNRLTSKAQYLLRDSLMVLGNQDMAPASVAIYYDDLSKPLQGGTGLTITLCRQKEIPVKNQIAWMKWIAE